MKSSGLRSQVSGLRLAALCASLFALGALTGCSGIPVYKAEEVHRTIGFPGFSDEIHALGITKQTAPDGTVIRKAETLTHTTTVLGVTRSATYKGAEIETKEGK